MAIAAINILKTHFTKLHLNYKKFYEFLDEQKY